MCLIEFDVSHWERYKFPGIVLHIDVIVSGGEAEEDAVNLFIVQFWFLLRARDPGIDSGSKNS